jgi:hypothetical protein
LAGSLESWRARFWDSARITPVRTAARAAASWALRRSRQSVVVTRPGASARLRVRRCRSGSRPAPRLRRAPGKRSPAAACAAGTAKTTRAALRAAGSPDRAAAAEREALSASSFSSDPEQQHAARRGRVPRIDQLRLARLARESPLATTAASAAQPAIERGRSGGKRELVAFATGTTSRSAATAAGFRALP